MDIFPALVFVMTFYSDGSGWTALRADLTGSVRIVKAIGVMICINPLGRAKGKVCNDAADADGFTLRGNKSIAQSEGSEATGIGDMALGPIGAKTHPERFQTSETGRIHGSYRLITFPF